MLNGLDLFSGIGGISLALSEWVRTVAYCEQDRYAQAVLLSRMADGHIDLAPIWDDVKTLKAEMLPRIDIVFGGFPCQDISVAGLGKGLGGERSGLFFEIIRLCGNIRPKFIFLENVPAITVRGLNRVCMELTSLGYDCRWTIISASEMGASHKRERWFCLAYSNDSGRRLVFQSELESKGKETPDIGGDGKIQSLAHPDCMRELSEQKAGKESFDRISHSGQNVANSMCTGLEGHRVRVGDEKKLSIGSYPSLVGSKAAKRWQDSWIFEPSVGRVADGIPHRVDRIKCLGNAVVPIQAREAFMRLVGIEARK